MLRRSNSGFRANKNTSEVVAVVWPVVAPDFFTWAVERDGTCFNKGTLSLCIVHHTGVITHPQNSAFLLLSTPHDGYHRGKIARAFNAISGRDNHSTTAKCMLPQQPFDLCKRVVVGNPKILQQRMFLCRCFSICSRWYSAVFSCNRSHMLKCCIPVPTRECF